MSRKSQISKFQAFNSYDSTVNGNSAASVVDMLDGFYYLVVVDPTVIGTLKCQFNDDRENNIGNYYDMNFDNTPTGMNIPIDGSVETEYLIKVSSIPKRTRLNWVNGAGTGNINAYIVGSAVGA